MRGLLVRVRGLCEDPKRELVCRVMDGTWEKWIELVCGSEMRTFEVSIMGSAFAIDKGIVGETRSVKWEMVCEDDRTDIIALVKGTVKTKFATQKLLNANASLIRALKTEMRMMQSIIDDFQLHNPHIPLECVLATEINTPIVLRAIPSLKQSTTEETKAMELSEIVSRSKLKTFRLVDMEYNRVFVCLGGTFGCPKRVKKVARAGETKDSKESFLRGVTADLNVVTQWVLGDLHKKDRTAVVHSYYFDSARGTKAHALTAIQNGLLFAVQRKAKVFAVCYSGHGASNTGDWVYTDGTVSLFDILTLYLRCVPLKDTHEPFYGRVTSIEIYRFVLCRAKLQLLVCLTVTAALAVIGSLSLSPLQLTNTQ